MKNKSKDTPIVIHTLSGNGAHFFTKLLENEQFKEKYLPNVKGIIIDSAPPKFTVERFTGGFTTAIASKLPPILKSKTDVQILNENIDTSEIQKHLMEKHWIITPIVYYAFQIYFNQLNGLKKFERLEKLLIKNLLHIPKLFIYSKNDKIVPESDIQYYIEKYFKNQKINQCLDSKSNLPLFDELVFKNSEHVAHFRDHPNDYSNKILNFLRKSLNK
jgi:hypothetical protein